jgi:ATP-binding cassette subfamily B protein RaxB
MVDKIFELRLLDLHCERLADIVLTKPEEPADSPGRLLGRQQQRVPDIAMRGVRYRYAEHAPYVLDGVELDVAAGECLAIVGASASGKSTLLHVLLGVLPASAGDVSIGGVPVSQLDDASRRAIGCVTQNDCLFAGSIADNISFCDPHADQSRVEECARIAALHAEVASLPMAYNTLVGFLGSTLSAGQQQRVLLARALYARPSVLILDEATSHLDVDSERAVASALRALNITRIIVAHRPETVATADRIVRLEAGRIVPVPAAPAKGSHSTRAAPFADKANAVPLATLQSPNAAEQDLLSNLGC